MNGVAVKIDGEPDSTMGASGGLCGKGAAGLQVLYDPNRVNTPLRRTNPEKGLFVDPKWEEITWEEAFDEIVPRLKKIISEDPKKLLWQVSVLRDTRRPFTDIPFRNVIGGPRGGGGGAGLHCGKGTHPVAGLMNASWSVVPDFKYCNYAIYFGTSKGVGSGHSAMVAARLAAEARTRGMKVVSFDPMCNVSGGKATEWIPIIPGTDGAVILAMCNVIVNELGIWDADYLKTKTNAPYLIGPDGKYIREKGPARGIKKAIPGAWGAEHKEVTYIGDDDTNKPLVFDAVDKKCKVYNDPTVKDYALEGNYKANGVGCQPAFQLIREHLRGYTPEIASKVSTVPAETIRRIATEFADAASVGNTITIDGYNLPLRPASAIIFRGGEGHENSYHTCFAVSLLNQIVGACDVPGGTLGWPARSLGYPGTGKLSWSPFRGVDGMLETDRFGPWAGLQLSHGPWPIKMPEKHHELELQDIFTGASRVSSTYLSDQEEIWEKTGYTERPEMMISWGNNLVMSCSNPDELAKILKKFSFIVVYELFNNEFTESFADIVLPATSYLEESTCEGLAGQNFNHAFGMEDWCCHINQPVVRSMHSRRQWESVLYELVDRLDVKERFVSEINMSLELDEDYKLKVTDKLTPEELSNRIVKNLFGAEHDYEWFKQHGFIRWPKKVEEAYWRYFINVRTPIYLEWMLELGEKMREITEEIALEVDYTQYTPLISWTPCSVHKVDNPEYDLYCFSYRDTLHTGSGTMEQPWIDEASKMNPYTYNVTMNADTAKKKGLEDGDLIEIESVYYGRKVKGTLKLLEGQHPEVVGIAACSGHWAKGMPIAKGKGTNFDILLELDRKHLDPVSWNIETAVRVKVRKVRMS